MLRMRALLTSMLWLSSTPVLAHSPTSDSGIEGPPYATIQQQMSQLAETYPEAVQLITYGTSVRGKQLQVLKIEDSATSRVNPRPAVLITGATHGNEYLNIGDRLPLQFLMRRNSLSGVSAYLRAGGVLYMLPILNPDGYDEDRRENANNKDLNRDFPLIPTSRPGFSQPETRMLSEYLEADLEEHNLRLKVSVDYHCCIGALLYPWSYTSRPVPPEDLVAHRRIAEKMVEIFGAGYEHGTTGEILGYRPRGTSKDYYYPKFGALTYTFEGKRNVENRNFEKHVQWWDWILGDLVGADQIAAR